jgi:hypothetical protein
MYPRSRPSEARKPKSRNRATSNAPTIDAALRRTIVVKGPWWRTG